MARRHVVFVPDDMWRKFGTGEIDHFEYGEEVSTAVYSDGHRETFDSAVTREEHEVRRVWRSSQK